ncbi:17.4 kDa class III heat shock protein [Euphorbia lathyris]|uniref:17.4 kDa class III heat shock protein n=1 Tax=Euphorbia lathyris TaxID=212925 RepID=UPI0033144779
MNRVGGDMNMFDAMSHLFSIPESLEKLMTHSPANENRGSIPVDILETEKEYIFYIDVPGLSKSDIQVSVEDERTLVIKSGGKRKREDDGEEEKGCKYIRLERRRSQKVMRKFRLPENANVAAISAKCENGVLSVVVEKYPPPPKPKKVEVAVS